jgi:hypothetical protein
MLYGDIRLSESEAMVTYVKSAVYLKKLSVNLHHVNKNLRSMLPEAP